MTPSSVRLPPEHEVLLEQMRAYLVLGDPLDACQGYSSEEIEQAEARLGFPLPALLRDLYLRLDVHRLALPAGWGSFLPLGQPSKVSRDEDLAWMRPSATSSSLMLNRIAPPPGRLLVITDAGCGRSLVVDCADAALRVLAWEDGVASAPDTTPAFSCDSFLAEGTDGETLTRAEDFLVERPSLLDWLQDVQTWMQQRQQRLEQWERSQVE